MAKIDENDYLDKFQRKIRHAEPRSHELALRCKELRAAHGSMREQRDQINEQMNQTRYEYALAEAARRRAARVESRSFWFYAAIFFAIVIVVLFFCLTLK